MNSPVPEIRCEAKIGRNNLLVPAIVLPAVVLLIPLVMAIESKTGMAIGRETWPTLLTAAYLSLALLITLLMVRQIRRPVELTWKSDCLDIRIPQKNLIYHSDLVVSVEDMVSVEEYDDQGYHFLSIQTRQGIPRRFHLMGDAGLPAYLSMCHQVRTAFEWHSALPAGK